MQTADLGCAVVDADTCAENLRHALKFATHIESLLLMPLIVRASELRNDLQTLLAAARNTESA
jgi:hypothetical protein